MLTNALVSKINFRSDDAPLIATGVEFVQDGRKFAVAAEMEVILCAGVCPRRFEAVYPLT